MDIDTDKIDNAVLALLYLNRFRHHKDDNYSSWKGFDWDALNRLHEKGYISNPVSKAKSVNLSVEGIEKSEELFRELFSKET